MNEDCALKLNLFSGAVYNTKLEEKIAELTNQIEQKKIEILQQDKTRGELEGQFVLCFSQLQSNFLLNQISRTSVIRTRSI